MNTCIPSNVYDNESQDQEMEDLAFNYAREAASKVAEFESQQVKDLLASEDLDPPASEAELRGMGYVMEKRFNPETRRTDLTLLKIVKKRSYVTNVNFTVEGQ